MKNFLLEQQQKAQKIAILNEFIYQTIQSQKTLSPCNSQRLPFRQIPLINKYLF